MSVRLREIHITGTICHSVTHQDDQNKGNLTLQIIHPHTHQYKEHTAAILCDKYQHSTVYQPGVSQGLKTILILKLLYAYHNSTVFVDVKLKNYKVITTSSTKQSLNYNNEAKFVKVMLKWVSERERERERRNYFET